MNKIVKIFSIMLLITLLIFQYSVISNAANEEGTTQTTEEEATQTAQEGENAKTEITLKIASDKIKKEEEIKVYIYLNNIKLEDGINGLEGSITYNKDVLEPITQNDTSYNGWNTTWNTENGKIIISRSNLTTQKQEIAELIFKVKEDTTAENTDIKLSNIVVSDGFEEDEEIEDATLKLTITEGETENPDDEDNKGENEPDNDPSNNEEQDNPGNGEDNKEDADNNGDNDNNKDDEEEEKEAVNNNSPSQSSNPTSSGTTGTSSVMNSKTATSSLPKTGINVWFIALAGIIVVIGIVSYNKYKKYKNV